MGNLFKSCDIPNTDSLTLSILVGLAQRERELISIRTKAALKTKKERGGKLGNPQNFTKKVQAMGHTRIKEKAAENINNKRAMSLVARCKKDGMTLEAIANELNQNGFVSSRGKLFHKTTMKRLYERYLMIAVSE